MNRQWIGWIGTAWLLAACSSEEPQPVEVDSSQTIHVAGLQTELVNVTTRATHAETIEWLKPSLQAGLDITYWHVDKPEETKKVALLKLGEDGTTYTFKYKDTGTNAQWYGNGLHQFQGFRVPEMLYSEALPENLSTDQSDDDATEESVGNYTLLTRYLSMPPNCRIAATVEQIRLPFQHRLARVLAYVLIDPEMGTEVKLEGDTQEDGSLDPNTTSFWFTKVDVLKGVKAITSESGITTYQPQWSGSVPKVIPHFFGRRGSQTVQDIEGRPTDHFYVYVHKKSGKHVYPSDSNWEDIHDSYSSSTATQETYDEIDYGKVPCFDLIVRPTYSSVTDVMYDEASAADQEPNSITFDLKLNNGLRYQKYFEFDLNANQQTVVYLLISKEKVDYDKSGSEAWVESKYNDGYYGVNNGNGNSLSLAGSSWQRAYRFDQGNGPSNVTDGSNYNEDEEEDHITGENGQYLSQDNWLKAFKGAMESGAHHGDYFILTGDIEIAMSELPDNFVFTGHLDGRGHTIKLTGTKGEENPETYLFYGLNGTYGGEDKSEAGTANLHWENNKLVPVKGYRAEVMNLTVAEGTLFKPEATFSGANWGGGTPYDVTGSVVNCSDQNGPVSNDVGLPDYQ